MNSGQLQKVEHSTIKRGGILSGLALELMSTSFILLAISSEKINILYKYKLFCDKCLVRFVDDFYSFGIGLFFNPRLWFFINFIFTQT